VIVAGIDEAGYGSVLGPLVVGCCALELPAAPGEPAAVPCGWATLKRLVKRTRDASGKRLHVNDSKKVYSPSIGLAELERSVLCLVATLHGEAESFAAFVRQTAGESCDGLDAHAWYRAAEGEAWPLANEPVALRIKANAARHELARAGAAVRLLHAHVVPESRLNAMFDTLQNKAATSFTFVAQHIDRLLSDFARPGEPLIIFCDRQGGRERYGSVLMQLFPDWALTVVDERPERSEYALASGDRVARLIFAEQAEQHCMSVALASMLSKYLREATMRRFNAWWRTHRPELRPTAGYYNDGLRFIEDIRATCVTLGIDPATLVRSR
jgi:hypothetical protein